MVPPVMFFFVLSSFMFPLHWAKKAVTDIVIFCASLKASLSSLLWGSFVAYGFLMPLVTSFYLRLNALSYCIYYYFPLYCFPFFLFRFKGYLIVPLIVISLFF